MVLDEQHRFDYELNLLLEKYRIRFFGGIYISGVGSGEQSGVTIASCVKVTPEMAGVVTSVVSQLMTVADTPGLTLFESAPPVRRV